MDFELNDDQIALADGVRSFCEGRFAIDAVRGLIDHGGVDRQRWTELAELGLFSLRLAEPDGGAGLGWTDAVVALEQLGRRLVPGPLVWTLLMAGVVDGAATGEAVVGGIERADPSGLVAHAGALDVLAVLDDDGVRTVDASSLELVPVEVPLDPLTPVARLVSPLPVGDLVVPASQVPELRAQAAVLTSALLLGVADGAVELAVAYARERQQFGRPIGAFQALKHLMADMYVRTELARASVYAAGVTLDDPSVGSILRASAGAKLTAGEAAVANGKTCIQVHGGMGYTWEVDAHLYLKRAYVLDAEAGTREHWADELGELLGAGR